ncbi:hypothetical protein Ae707Ps1_5923c [Pseudonocardia sp. Ae707_Ps1]|nr:hypothetical protein Ae707Ps1_5923c [Pseudonocardia sp. Ae707_Ps1]
MAALAHGPVPGALDAAVSSRSPKAPVRAPLSEPGLRQWRGATAGADGNGGRRPPLVTAVGLRSQGGLHRRPAPAVPGPPLRGRSSAAAARRGGCRRRRLQVVLAVTRPWCLPHGLLIVHGTARLRGSGVNAVYTAPPRRVSAIDDSGEVAPGGGKRRLRRGRQAVAPEPVSPNRSGQRARVSTRPRRAVAISDAEEPGRITDQRGSSSWRRTAHTGTGLARDDAEQGWRARRSRHPRRPTPTSRAPPWAGSLRSSTVHCRTPAAHTTTEHRRSRSQHRTVGAGRGRGIPGIAYRADRRERDVRSRIATAAFSHSPRGRGVARDCTMPEPHVTLGCPGERTTSRLPGRSSPAQLAGTERPDNASSWDWERTVEAARDSTSPRLGGQPIVAAGHDEDRPRGS